MLTSLLKSIRAIMSLSLFSSFFQHNHTGYRIYRARLKVASLVISVIRAEVAKTDISFLSCPSLFEIWKNFLQNAPLVTVVTNSLAYVFLISIITCSAGDINRIDISSQRAGVPPSLRLTILPLLFLSSLLVGGFADRRGV